jgi:xanthine dehydrogenase accessory factor
VTWIDPRAGAFPSHVPANVTCRAGNEPVRVLDEAPDGAFVAIMTHSHALDLDVAAAALKARRFPYVGLIGSGTKRARFASTLRQIGLATEDIERLICPIGLTEIQDKAPGSIAASIAAQLLIKREAVTAATATVPGRVSAAGASHA